MEIEHIKVTPIEVPLETKVSGSGYSKETRNTIIVEITTESGVTGRIYSGDERDAQDELVKIISNNFQELVVGEDLFKVTKILEKLTSQNIKYGSKRLYMHAISAVELAIWDTIGKALEKPLYEIWGSYRDNLPIIAIGGYYKNDLFDNIGEEVKDYKSMGVAGMKLKVGGATVEEDLERLRLAREVGGDEFTIVCDSNLAWDMQEATEFIEKANQYDISWVEEPISWINQYSGLKNIQQDSSIPICAGQSEVTPDDCVRLIDDSSVDIINYDASLGGGYEAWKEVSIMAKNNGKKMAHHEEPHIAMQLLGSIPHGLFVECFHPKVDPIWYKMLENTPTIKDGFVNLPEEPGFGLNLDDDFINKYQV